MGVYAGFQNNRSRAAIVFGNKITPEAIDEIMVGLDTKYKELADWVIGEYETRYPALRETFRRIRNVDLGYRHC